jgi:Tfp pilus assembly protein PilX
MSSARRRGASLLLVIALVTLLTLAAVSLMGTTAVRYHATQFARDRLQALECAQAGLLAARAQMESGNSPDSTIALALGDVGSARVTFTPQGEGLRVASLGSALRDGEVQATRLLEVVWEVGRP